MADLTGAIRSLIFLTVLNTNKSHRRHLGLITGDLDKVSTTPITLSKISSISPADAPSLPHIPLSFNPALLKIKSMSTNTKTLSVPPRRKRTALIPPLLPPLLPPLPLLPLPLLPLIPPPILPLTLLPKIVKPIKSLETLKRKAAFEKTLRSVGKVKPVILPELSAKKSILEKLLDLKRKGSLTTAEFIRFKKLLLH